MRHPSFENICQDLLQNNMYSKDVLLAVFLIREAIHEMEARRGGQKQCKSVVEVLVETVPDDTVKVVFAYYLRELSARSPTRLELRRLYSRVDTGKGIRDIKANDARRDALKHSE